MAYFVRREGWRKSLGLLFPMLFFGPLSVMSFSYGIDALWDVMWRTDEERAIRAIMLANGTIVRDDTTSGQPIVKVSFRMAQPRHESGYFNDNNLRDVMPHLQALAQLRELDLSDTEITEAGISSLSRLQDLKRISLGSTDPLEVSKKEREVSPKAVEALRKDMPNTEIIIVDRMSLQELQRRQIMFEIIQGMQPRIEVPRR
jgi:hypothetical protein